MCVKRKEKESFSPLYTPSSNLRATFRQGALDNPSSKVYIEVMDVPYKTPAIVHIPIKQCEICGKPALAGSDYCIPHTAEYEEFIGENADWAIGLRPMGHIRFKFEAS